MPYADVPSKEILTKSVDSPNTRDELKTLTKKTNPAIFQLIRIALFITGPPFTGKQTPLRSGYGKTP